MKINRTIIVLGNMKNLTSIPEMKNVCCFCFSPLHEQSSLLINSLNEPYWDQPNHPLYPVFKQERMSNTIIFFSGENPTPRQVTWIKVLGVPIDKTDNTGYFQI